MNKLITQYKNSSQKGFTLVELLFSMALISFMLVIMLSSFLGVFRFYIWSRTTMATQESARQMLDDFTREVQTKTEYRILGPGSMCANDENGIDSEGGVRVKSVKFSFISADSNATPPSNGSLIEEKYSSINCTGLISSRAISKPNLSITEGNFIIVNGVGPANNSKPSVIINFNITNGTPDPSTGQCRPSDNFCDKAFYQTAVTSR